MIEHVRMRDDGANTFMAGAATSMVLAANCKYISYVSGIKKRFDVFRCWRRLYVLHLLQSI
jgi:hypothetical protein